MGGTAESPRTRDTLLARVKDPSDDRSWREFHDFYRPIVISYAQQQGLSEDEAKDVAQESFVALVEALPTYRYDRQRASFRTWLRSVVKSRVADHFRRQNGRTGVRARIMARDRPSTQVLESVPGPETADLGDVFEAEWQSALLARAMAELQVRVTTKNYQAFYLSLHGKTTAEIARMLGLSHARVYLAKHRLAAKLRQLVKELEARYS
jgi:RNA polymerase sigma-70 factor (ECF subfamily)